MTPARVQAQLNLHHNTVTALLSRIQNRKKKINNTKNQTLPVTRLLNIEKSDSHSLKRTILITNIHSEQELNHHIWSNQTHDNLREAEKFIA